MYQKKMDAARAVGYRESLLMQLNAVILHWPRDKSQQANQQQHHRSHHHHGFTSVGGGNANNNNKLGSINALPEAARLLKNMSVDLREAGLRCVEKIVSWVLAVSNDSSIPQPFLWNGTDYLLKMSADPAAITNK